MKLRHVHTRIGSIVGAAFLLAAVGCNQPVDGGEDPSESASAELAEGEQAELNAHDKEHFKKGKFGHKKKGASMLFKKALELDDLSETQRSTIEGLRADMKADFDPEAHSAFQTELAAQVRAGAIDDGFVDEHVAAMSEKMAARSAKHSAALQTLHSTLTAEQRAALVATAEAKCGAHGDKARGDKARGDKKFRKRSKDGKRGKLAKGKHAMFLEGLNLTEEQEAQLHEARAEMKGDRPDREAMKSKRTAMRDKKKAMFAAFATDDFDATAYAKADMSERMAAKLEKKVEMMRTLVSILDAEQRATLAERIEKGKRGHKKGMKGMKGDKARRGLRR
jgi:Spy/CpxP family protein refolding chaperone